MKKIFVRKLNNDGLSLVEILVVMAIMGILIGMSMSLFGLVQSGNTSNVAKSVVTAMQEVRQKTMSQNLAGGFDLKVTQDADGVISTIQTKYEKQPDDSVIPVDTVSELKKANMFYNDGAGEKKIKSLTCSYNATTGAVKSIVYTLEDGSVGTTTSGTVAIRFTTSSKESTVMVYFVTGKCEVK